MRMFCIVWLKYADPPVTGSASPIIMEMITTLCHNNDDDDDGDDEECDGDDDDSNRSSSNNNDNNGHLARLTSDIPKSLQIPLNVYCINCI